MATPVPRKALSFKVLMLGDAQVGKTALMIKYINNKFDTTYIETIGVNTMEKIIQLPNLNVNISLWDLGGQKEFISLLPAICCDVRVIFFVFDLTQKSSLLSIKSWYKNTKKEKKKFRPFLIGTKFDLFEQSSDSYKIDISSIARNYAQRMKAPLIYCSAAQSINVRKTFKLLTGNLLHLKPKIKQKTDETKDALLEFHSTHLNYCKSHRKHKTVLLGETNYNWIEKEKGNETNSDLMQLIHGHQNQKQFKKRVKRIKSQLDSLKNDRKKLEEIEQILGISM